MSNLPALRLPRKKARSIFQIVGSAGFVLISLMLLVIGLTSRSLDAQAFAFVTAGLLGVVVFGFFAFLSLRTLARPALIVDDRASGTTPRGCRSASSHGSRRSASGRCG